MRCGYTSTCEFDNCLVKNRRHYHIDNEIIFLSDNEIYCEMTGKTQDLTSFQDTEKLLGKNFPNAKIHNRHCNNCHEIVPEKIEITNIEQVEYDCCYTNNRRSIDVLEIKHKCHVGEYVIGEKTYSPIFICSPKFWEKTCNICVCEHEKCSPGEVIGGGSQDCMCLFCFWNPCVMYKQFGNCAKGKGMCCTKKNLPISPCNGDFHRCLINNNLGFACDSDFCFNMFSYHSLGEKFNLKKECICGEIVSSRTDHCTKCNKHYHNDTMIHPDCCCNIHSKNEKHCKDCHNNYSEKEKHCKDCHKNYRADHCCKCGEYTHISQKHCEKCHKIYSRHLAHCCDCGEHSTWCNHCDECHKVYESNLTHNENHKTYDASIEDYCSGCNLMHKKELNHCSKCHKTYDPKKLFHCTNCCASYGNAKKCPFCSTSSMGNKCLLCSREVNGKHYMNSCGHSFHIACYGMWNGNVICPICPEKIDLRIIDNDQPIIMPSAKPFGT